MALSHRSGGAKGVSAAQEKQIRAFIYSMLREVGDYAADKNI